MKKILCVILAAILILGIFAASCGPFGPCYAYGAPIEDVAIWADESLPPKYFLDVVSGFSSCDGYSSSYKVTRRVGNTTIEVEIWNGTCHPECSVDSYVDQTIPLGSQGLLWDEIAAGVNYTVEVNDVTVTFVAGVMIYLAPIHDIEIWADNSSPSQYFVDVVSGEPSICDHFNSYNLTRASNTTVIVEIFNLSCGTGCPAVYSYVENTIPLGSDFVTGGNYTVVVNNVTETFVA